MEMMTEILVYPVAQEMECVFLMAETLVCPVAQGHLGTADG